MVEDIIFDNCKVGGKNITSISDADFRINRFTGNIKFNP
jgi:hypothetical protein